MLITKIVASAWEAIMDETKNPLRNLPIQTAHLAMQLLAWMWSTIFSLAVGSYLVFGITALGHVLVILGIFLTMIVFRNAETKNQAVSVNDRSQNFADFG